MYAKPFSTCLGIRLFRSFVFFTQSFGVVDSAFFCIVFLFFTFLCPCRLFVRLLVHTFRFVSFVLFGVFCLFNIRKFCSMRECVSFLSVFLFAVILWTQLNTNQPEQFQREMKWTKKSNAYFRLTFSLSTFTIDDYEITGFSSSSTFCSFSYSVSQSFWIFDSIEFDVIAFLVNFGLFVYMRNVLPSCLCFQHSRLDHFKFFS